MPWKVFIKEKVLRDAAIEKYQENHGTNLCFGGSQVHSSISDVSGYCEREYSGNFVRQSGENEDNCTEVENI